MDEQPILTAKLIAVNAMFKCFVCGKAWGQRLELSDHGFIAREIHCPKCDKVGPRGFEPPTS